MRIGRSAVLLAIAATAALLSAPAARADEPCPYQGTERAKCFGLESLAASLSTNQAGAHPDLNFTFDIKKDPESDPNIFGLRDSFAPTRNVRIELPPGLIGDPSAIGLSQQCTAEKITSALEPGGGCPNGSQVGVAQVHAYGLNSVFRVPIYMMRPPGGEVVARLGMLGGLAPLFIDASVRTESDYGLNLEVVNAPSSVSLIRTEGTTWGVPEDESHDRERCTASEVILIGCKESPPRPPGGAHLPFLTNPTRCGVPLQMRVGAASWAEPQRFDFATGPFPQLIAGCNRLPFGAGLTIEPTSHRAAAPTGLDITEILPAAKGVEVLEPSQLRDIEVRLPEGVSFNPAAADGLEVCSEDDVHLGQDVAADCPDGAKMAAFEAEIPALPRRVRGALYLRAPEPGNLFRVWIVADDQGIHVKLQGQLVVDEQTGQITTVLHDIPQAPLREAKFLIKSGLRAPLINPSSCGTYASDYEFTPWSGGFPESASTSMQITEGCDTGGFDPKLSAGVADPTAGRHSSFLFNLTREDGEQNPASLEVTLPKGLTATLAGVTRCEGNEAATGHCPAASRIGKVLAAAGAGPKPLWVPQPGKRPTAVYLAGPYKDAPLSVVAVVPAQAGPFDLGDQVVRSAIYLDPTTAQGTVKSDPLPQILEGVPIPYRTVQVELDRPNFTLNPTGCAPKAIEATITSTEGATAHPSSPFHAANCARLAFKPRISFRLFGGTTRGAHPKLRTILRPRPGQANIGSFSVALPHSEFLDQAHIKTVCTRVQFKADQCPPGSIYGKISATTPIIDEPLTGNLYLRSSNHLLPDMVAVLEGPPSLPIKVETAGRIDSVNGGVRATFEAVPDAPITKVVATFPGGKKGLLENSTNLCLKTRKATAEFTGQNGREATLRPVMQVKCEGKAKGKRHGAR